MGALHRQIQEFVQERDRYTRNEEEYRRQVTEQYTQMAQFQKVIPGLCKTVAGFGFSPPRLMKEADEGRKSNNQVESCNNKLPKQWRRAVRKFLHLGN